MLQIRIHGRGGQGVVTAAEMRLRRHEEHAIAKTQPRELRPPRQRSVNAI